MIELLVTQGVDVNATDADGHSAVELAGRTDWTPPPGAIKNPHVAVQELVFTGNS